MRIPITMCHGIGGGLDLPRYKLYFGIAREMGFDSISYDDLAVWWWGDEALPDQPIMFDFDHAVGSIVTDILPVMNDHGFRGNLFVHTAPMEAGEAGFMTWEQVGRLIDAGWQIGAHTHTHPDLSELAGSSSGREAILEELETCDRILTARTGAAPKDFAFTGTTWSRTAEELVSERYRFGRLWIIGRTYQADGAEIRYAEIAGVDAPDEADGGPPVTARYITRSSHPHRLPSMELSALIFEEDAYRAYLQGAMD